MSKEGPVERATREFSEFSDKMLKATRLLSEIRTKTLRSGRRRRSW